MYLSTSTFLCQSIFSAEVLHCCLQIFTYNSEVITNKLDVYEVKGLNAEEQEKEDKVGQRQMVVEVVRERKRRNRNDRVLHISTQFFLNFKLF